MKVLKFGGTSVGTVKSLHNVQRIINKNEGKVVVVVSALGGLTDKLIETATIASKGDPAWKKEMEKIKTRHIEVLEKVVLSEKKDETAAKVNSQLEGLKRNIEGIFLLRSLPEKALDVIVSFGERISSVIVAGMFETGKRYFAPDFIKTERWYGRNIISPKITDELIRETFSQMGNNEKAIVTGFISTDLATSEITNLGRGGSDYTGALIAAALDAESFEIWTDVDGFMTADPRTVKEAFVIPELSFTESMELCSFGAKVVYPPTIYPVFHKNIPIKILNTFNPETPGSLISEKKENDKDYIKGISSLKGVSVIKIEVEKGILNNEINKRVLNTLSKNSVKIIQTSQGTEPTHLKYAVISSQPAACLEIIIKELAPEITKRLIPYPELSDNQRAIAIVGRNMKERERLALRILHSLQRKGFEIGAFSIGNSNSSLIYILPEENGDEALNLIHGIVFGN